MEDKFYCVYGWMTKELGLRGSERDVFAVIYSFSVSCGEFTGGAQYLADRTGVSRQSVCAGLKKLLQKDLLTKTEYVKQGLKYCNYRVSDRCLSRIRSLYTCQDPLQGPVKFSDEACQDSLQEPVKFSAGTCRDSLPEPVKFSDETCRVSLHHNKEYNKEKNKENRKESTKPDKPIRYQYGEYENVLLSDGEAEKLKREYPDDWRQRIDRLSEYMASTGKRYQNHLATIRAWARKDAPKPAAKGLYADLKGGIEL